MKEYSRKFYNSTAWRKCQKSYLSSVDGLCERCKAQGKVQPADIVHHKTYITPENINDANITLNWDNLEALCQDCHNKEHHGADQVAEGLMFDANGDLVTRGVSI